MERTVKTQAPPSKGTPVAAGAAPAPLAPELLRKMDAYWRAANYLSVGQIYLYDNPLLREPLKLEHVKPRLLGHWGTTPGQNFIRAGGDAPADGRDARYGRRRDPADPVGRPGTGRHRAAALADDRPQDA